MYSREPAPSADSIQFALRVALQTMSERCIELQRRTTALENENRNLLENKLVATGRTDDNNELLQMRLELAELQQRQEHFYMVSNENRNLWARLSKMTKEQDKSCVGGNDSASPRSSTSANQNLIRSKTFTQHSPNPNLRLKLIPTATAVGGEKSLEEVQLDNYQSNNRELGAGEDYADAAESDLDFAYLHVAGETTGANDADLNLEAKKCIKGVQELRREALLQQQQLNKLLAAFENSPALRPCPECMQKSQKPEMADKSLETDESLSEVKFYNNISQETPQASCSKANNFVENSLQTRPQLGHGHLNIIQEKIKADSSDKICPMCAKTYADNVTFDDFCKHVESHFIDEGDVEGSLDRHYEIVSHAVGDF